MTFIASKGLELMEGEVTPERLPIRVLRVDVMPPPPFLRSSLDIQR